jgi:mannose-6-phosphate isomerase-like protein (cupin superfamily)
MTSHNPEPESRNAHDQYHVLGATVSITADAETTDGEYLVLDMLVPPGFENGLHTHEQSEVFHVVEGEARLHVDGRDEVLRPGTPATCRVANDTGSPPRATRCVASSRS